MDKKDEIRRKPSLSAMMTIASAFGVLNVDAYGNSRVPANKLSGVDIKKEYALIQQKKSGLSSNMRKLVIKRHESNGV